LPLALSGRFRAHHAFLLSQILAHIDYVEEAIETLSQQIGELLALYADAVERLSTIPGVKQRTAEVIVAEVGVDMAAFPRRGPSRQLGGAVPGQQREGWQASLRLDPPGQP